jgi:hypothetical protein
MVAEAYRVAIEAEGLLHKRKGWLQKFTGWQQKQKD